MDVGIGVEAINDRFDFFLRRRGGKVFIEGSNADLLALLDLHLHVASTRGILTDEQGAEPRSTPVGAETRHAFGEFHLDSLGEAFSVE
jgi:hypothetical protein